MKAFIDTSAMMKKYVRGQGSDDFDSLLEDISEIIVAPVYLIEVNSAIERRIREKIITLKQANWLKKEVNTDALYYSKVIWNVSLENTALRLIGSYPLKTLDSIQLASAALSNAAIFITSDRKLSRYAELELRAVKLV